MATRDLTSGSIPRHLMNMAAFIGFGLAVQTLYVLVDLYFVARLGEHAVAGVTAAASTMFAVLAASQLVSVGALSLIARAIGRKDQGDAQTIFDQALSMSLAAALVTLILGYAFGDALVTILAADGETAALAHTYLLAYLPALAIMFPGAALGSALRAAGVVAGPMVLQCLSVILNAVLAPVLIVGWGTGLPLGVAGAGLASSIASVAGTIALLLLFNRLQTLLRLHLPSLRPRLRTWLRIAAIGLPASGEFLLIFLVSALLYWSIRSFGADAQAGFGIGSRVMQSIFLPAMAIAFAASPIAGQNFGAGHADRVRGTFRHAALIGSAVMLTLTLLCQIRPDLLVHPFTEQAAVQRVATDYLRIISWNFVAVGLVFACSGMFQALGNTIPSLLSSASRFVTFALPAIWLAGRPGTELHDFWYVSVASVTVQALLSVLLLRRELHLKLSARG
ncbi:MATE family efflux transporter [Sphingosinicella sp. BN140058]|uniref:MATE family efflux transporter n=1 Tax=Sphingosinicella sp. BN140058 TaxID=1892855 RepID=UPI001012370C|nr:MATE family efflux transporter [Sphingosinicella sp. BN140058]QAY76248.1 MATE family efflux transporter [Sphingosinicella sp. BN140058]